MDSTHTTARASRLLAVLYDDAWALPHADRRHLFGAMQAEQEHWLPRLRTLADAPGPGEAFPAFLLATEAFAGIRTIVADAIERQHLSTGEQDLVDRFVDHYRNWLLWTEDQLAREDVSRERMGGPDVATLVGRAAD